MWKNYTLERDGRELQPNVMINAAILNYTLERDGRELQHDLTLLATHLNYTLERDGRELQPRIGLSVVIMIIPLREMEGNYNLIDTH